MKKLLQEMVRDHNVLLHGSPKRVNELIPLLTDGEMAICATDYPEVAIFMALVGCCENKSYGYSVFKKDTGAIRIIFRISKERVNYLLQNNPTAFVYALDVEHFRKVSLIEHRTYDSVYVKNTYAVTLAHLPFMLSEDQYEYSVLVSNQSAKLLQ